MKESTCHPLVVSMETGESVGMSRKSQHRLVGFSGDGQGLSEILLSSPPTSTWGGCWDSRPSCNEVRHLVDSFFLFCFLVVFLFNDSSLL